MSFDTQQQQQQQQQQESESNNENNNSNNDNDSSSLVWYFAIGSMMHPMQCQQRKFVPIQSHPAKLVGYELGFFGTIGVAEAVECSLKKNNNTNTTNTNTTTNEQHDNDNNISCSMHGVLHQVTMEQMKQLDDIELGYIRKQGIAIPYKPIPKTIQNKDNNNNDESSLFVSSVTATVYCRSDEVLKTMMESTATSPDECIPTQRYIELLVQGAKHWGVNDDYIQFIQNRPIRKRKDPSQFYLVEPVDSNKFFDTIPDDTDTEIYFSLNGKVICYQYQPYNHPMAIRTRTLKQVYGPHTELYTSKLLYDVKYGAPSSLEQFTKEHSAYIEDLTWEFRKQTHSEQYLKVLGIYTPQTWID